MKKGRWIIFRIAVYLCMVTATLFMMLMFYFGTKAGRMSGKEWTIYWLILLIPAAQVSFQLLNARMLHLFLPENVLPGKAFKTWHSVLLCLNAISVIVIGFIIIEALAAVGVQETDYPNRKSLFWQHLVIGVLISIAAINFYTIMASLQLRGYLQRQYVSAQNQWLENIGNN